MTRNEKLWLYFVSALLSAMIGVVLWCLVFAAMACVATVMTNWPVTTFIAGAALSAIVAYLDDVFRERRSANKKENPDDYSDLIP